MEEKKEEEEAKGNKKAKFRWFFKYLWLPIYLHPKGTRHLNGGRTRLTDTL